MAIKLLPNKLDRQVALIISAVVIVAISIFANFSYRHMTEDIEHSLQKQGEAISGNIAKIGAPYIFNKDHKSLNTLVQYYIDLPNINKIIIYDSNGKTILQNQKNSLQNNKHSHENDQLHHMVAASTNLPKQNKPFYDAVQLSAWAPVGDEKSQAWVEVNLNEHVISHHRVDHLISNYVFALITTLSIALITLIVLRKPFRYIKQSANYAEHLDNSNRGILPIYENAIELKILGESLNLASRRLSINEQETMEAIETLETQKFAMDQHSIVSITNTLGEITYANNKLCEVSGYSRAELIGSTHAILKSGKHDNEFFSNLWDSITQGKVWQGEVCNLTKCSKEFWTATTIVPFLDNNNQPYQYVAIRNDITALKQTTNELFESEQRLKLSQTFAKMGSWELSLLNNIITFSTNAHKLLGDPKIPLEISIDQHLQLLHPNDKEQVTQALKNCIASGEMYQVEYRVIWPDHSTHWIQNSGNVLHDSENHPIKVLGVSQDITDRKNYETEIETLARFPSENPNPVLRVDYDMRLIYGNPASKDLLSYWEVDNGDMLPGPIIKVALENLANKQSSSIEIKVGKSFYASTIAYVPNTQYLNIYMQDITLRKLAETQVKNYQKHLEDLVDERTADLVNARDDALVAERSMSAFLTNMTHELRTPLHAILSFADFGVKKINKAPEEKLLEYFKKIHHSGNNLLELVNNLLDLSKLRAGKMSYKYYKQDIEPVMEQVISEVIILAQQKDIHIEFKKSSRSTAIEFDKVRLSQVIRNLLSNAIKFSKATSQITISSNYTSEGVEISVIDSGMGIPNEELLSIFESFSQSSLTTTSAGGTGLGLPICKEIIEGGHNGWILASNNESGGATFEFFIPFEQTPTSNFANFN